MPAPGDSGGQHFVGSRLTVDKAEIGNLQNPAASNIVVTDADQLITGVKAVTGGITSDASGKLPGDTTTSLPAGAGIQAGPQWDWGGEKFHAKAAGLKGDGTNEDMTKVAALIAKGGTTFFDDGNYKFPTPASLLLGSRIRGTAPWQAGTAFASRVGTKFTGTAGQNVFNLLDTGVGGASSETQNVHLEGFAVTGGADQLYAANGGVGVTLKTVAFDSPGHAGIYWKGFNQEWFGDDVEFMSGQYGVYFNAEVGHGGTGTARLYDKCHWNNIYMHGQSINGGLMMIGATSSNVVWDHLRLVTIVQDGFIVAGGLNAWEIRAPSTESNGYTGSAPTPPTTATTTSGSAVVAVASSSGLAPAQVVTIKGAGTNGLDWYPTILTVDSGVQVTMTTTAPTTVTSQELVNYLYSDFKIVNSGAAPAGLLFTNPQWGIASTLGAVRYSLDCGGATFGIVVTGSPSGNNRPIYDPSNFVALWGSSGNLPIRRPNNFLTESFRTSSFGGSFAETGRTQIASPPGRDIVLGLQDSTSNQSGTIGNIEGRRGDSNRSRFFYLDNRGHFTPSMASGTPTTSALNAHVSSATPAGSDQSGKITIGVDGTGVAAGQTLFTVNYGAALAIQWGAILLVDASTDTTLATVRFHAANLGGSSYQVVCDGALTAGKTYIVNYMCL